MKKGFKFSEEEILKRIGKKLSEETKLKMSLTKLGKKLTEETKIKIGKGNRGKKISQEAKEKIRLSRLGTKHSQETLEKLRVASIGEKNPMWKGGRKLNGEGYIMILKHEHPNSDSKGYIMEHRVIIEEIMRRYLKSREVVHHINGIKDDNKKENLMIFANNGEHLKHHKELRKNGSEI